MFKHNILRPHSSGEDNCVVLCSSSGRYDYDPKSSVVKRSIFPNISEWIRECYRNRKTFCTQKKKKRKTSLIVIHKTSRIGVKFTTVTIKIFQGLSRGKRDKRINKSPLPEMGKDQSRYPQRISAIGPAPYLKSNNIQPISNWCSKALH